MNLAFNDPIIWIILAAVLLLILFGTGRIGRGLFPFNSQPSQPLGCPDARPEYIYRRKGRCGKYGCGGI